MAAINKDKELLITQELLKERIQYDKGTGVFTWLDVKVNGNKARNKRAGSIDRAGYVQIGFSVNGKSYMFSAHRLAWLYEYGGFPSENLDHLNHNKTDNSIINLRIATNRENLRNQSMSSNNTTGYTGVSFNKHADKYEAYITVNYKRKHLGCFENVEDAGKAAQEARAHYGFHENHGENRNG